MKFSKTKIIGYLFLIIIIYLQISYFDPLFKKIYFYNDKKSIENSSWYFSIIFSSILYLIIMIYLNRKTIEIKKTKFPNLLLLIFFTLLLKTLIMDDLLLFLNIKMNIRKETKNYIVFYYGPKNISLIHENKNEIITDEIEINKINTIRLSKNKKSLYDFKDKDTLNIVYNIGFMDIKFLE